MRRTLENTLRMIKVTFLNTADLLLNIWFQHRLQTFLLNLLGALDQLHILECHQLNKGWKVVMYLGECPKLTSALVEDPSRRVNSTDVWLCGSSLPIMLNIVIPRLPSNHSAYRRERWAERFTHQDPLEVFTLSSEAPEECGSGKRKRRTEGSVDALKVLLKEDGDIFRGVWVLEQALLNFLMDSGKNAKRAGLWRSLTVSFCVWNCEVECETAEPKSIC